MNEEVAEGWFRLKATLTPENPAPAWQIHALGAGTTCLQNYILVSLFHHWFPQCKELVGAGDTDDEAQGTRGTGERAARLHERGDRSVVCWCAQVQAAKLAAWERTHARVSLQVRQILSLGGQVRIL